MSIYFEQNLIHTIFGTIIPVATNVRIFAAANLNDDITLDKLFQGVEEENAIAVFNTSGLFTQNGINQSVDVLFNVYIPFGTLGGKYITQVATRIIQS